MTVDRLDAMLHRHEPCGMNRSLLSGMTSLRHHRGTLSTESSSITVVELVVDSGMKVW